MVYLVKPSQPGLQRPFQKNKTKQKRAKQTKLLLIQRGWLSAAALVSILLVLAGFRAGGWSE